MCSSFQKVYLWDSVDNKVFMFPDLFKAADFLGYTMQTVRNKLLDGKAIGKRYFVFDAERVGLSKLLNKNMNVICTL